MREVDWDQLDIAFVSHVLGSHSPENVHS
jgi:hypothetical protein